MILVGYKTDFMNEIIEESCNEKWKMKNEKVSL